MLRYKGYLFDWDGTLANSTPVWKAAMVEALKEIDVAVTSDQLNNLLGGWDIKNTKSLEHIGIPDSYHYSQTVRAQRGVSEIHEVELHDNALTVIDTIINKQAQVAVVTNSFDWLIKKAVLHHNLHNHFTTVVARETTGFMKPHPQPILHALSVMDVLAQDSVIVGDSVHDIEAGRAAGVKTAYFYPKVHHELFTLSTINTYGADYIIEDLRELL